MIRRSFLASLFAPFLARFAPKTSWPTERVLIRGNNAQGFIEFPERIEQMTVFMDELYVFTKSGVYRVFRDHFGDHRYEKLNYVGFLPVHMRALPW